MPPLEEDNDLRSTLEGAFDATEEQSEAGRPTADPEKPVRATPEEGKAGRQTEGQPRTPEGKFDRKAAAEKPADRQPDDRRAGDRVPAGDPAQKEAARPAPVDEFSKPPASWKAGARENWHHLPADVRAEVYRREQETSRVLSQSAEARQVAEQVQSIAQKYAPALNAEGVDLATATENLMDLAQRLRFGPPPEKAMLVAKLIQTYGVDIQTLDSILSNTPMPAHAQMHAQQLRDPRVDGLLSQIAQARQAEEQRTRQVAQQEVGQFGSNREFFEDVRETMADLIEVAVRRGIDLSLDEAYKRACYMDPEISKVLTQRAAAGTARNGQPSTARAKAASSSVRSTPVTGSAASQPENLRGALEAAWDDVSGS